ncbi:MAG: YD repeat-containing protein [Treponema sp.]|nr:YD repeat-containing protein [Treponema sp.]
MQRVILFTVALLLSIATCSQTGGRQTGDPFEVRQDVYFADGSLDEYTTSEWSPSFSHIAHQRRFSASGALLEQVEFSFNEEMNRIQTRLTRDVEERLRNRTVYQYNSQNRLFRESLVDNRGRVVSTHEFTYDNRGNLISRVIKNRAGDTLAETVYTYNAQGRMASSQTKDAGGTVISSTAYTYDGQGNLTRQNVTDSNGIPTTIVTATWRDGLEIENIMTTASTNAMQLRVRNEYGQNRELLTRNIENFQGNSTQVIRFTYIFRPRR